MSSTPIATSSKEVFYDANVNNLAGNSAVHYIFPPVDLYNNNNEVIENYSNIPDDKVVNVDIAFLRLNTYKDTEQYINVSYDDGEFKDTNIAGAFWAANSTDYYYKYNGGGTITAPLLHRGSNIPTIGESIKLPLNSTGASFENKSLGMATLNVNRFDDLEVEGLNEGYKPNSMQSSVIRLEGTSVEDVMYRCFDAASVSTSTPITDANIITEQVNGGGSSHSSHFLGVDADFIEEEINRYVHEDSANYSSTDYVSAVEIVNVERTVDDLRYGDIEDELPFIFTGASHYFTDAELATVKTSTSTPINNVVVHGGDCFVGLHTFKLTDSCYSITDSEKLIDGTGANYSPSVQTARWDYYFEKTNTATAGEDISRPFPLKGVSQTLTVLLESEVNPELVEKIPHNTYDYDSTLGTSTTNFPVPIVDDAGQIRSNFKYYFNLDYAKQNNYKVFFPYNQYEKNINLFGARLVYSDQKIYNTDIEGFDRFRALNIYDLDETNGSLSKLQEAGDRIYALQENAFSYIPITAQTVETADGSNLTVRSGEIIGIPIKVNTLYGTQDPKTVKTNSNMIFFVDRLRGEPCIFDGKEIQLLSRLGMESFFSSILSTITSGESLTAIFDNKKKEYIVYFRESDSAVFNLEFGLWSSRYPEQAGISTLGGTRIGDTMMVVGVGADVNFNAASLYSEGNIGEWWGQAFTPSFKFYVNPEPESSKTFDAFTMLLDRIPVPKTFDVVLEDGTIVTADLSTETPQYQGGSYRFKNVRVTHENGVVASASTLGRRLRGVYGEMEVELITTEQSGTTSVLTKYRTSYRPI